MINLIEFSLLYALIGLAIAITIFCKKHKTSFPFYEAPLLFLFWPLYAPFVFTREEEGGSAEASVAFLVALQKAEKTPLANLLPDPKTARLLSKRLKIASQKVEEIDMILTRPTFSEESTRKRQQELQEKGASSCAISSVEIRLQNILRLRALRDRFSRELDDVKELLTQLTTQAEVLRLAGSPDDSVSSLIQEILSRVEALDQVLHIDVTTSP